MPLTNAGREALEALETSECWSGCDDPYCPYTHPRCACEQRARDIEIHIILERQ